MGRFTINILHERHGQATKEEMKRSEMPTKLWLENLKGRDLMKDLYIDQIIILKRILRNSWGGFKWIHLHWAVKQRILELLDNVIPCTGASPTPFRATVNRARNVRMYFAYLDVSSACGLGFVHR
jgi:hypothetical protein